MNKVWQLTSFDYIKLSYKLINIIQNYGKIKENNVKKRKKDKGGICQCVIQVSLTYLDVKDTALSLLGWLVTDR